MSNSPSLLRGKKIVVIGGSSGIGFRVSEASLAHGASVVISSSSSDKVASAVQRLQSGLDSDSSAQVSGQPLEAKNPESITAFLDGIGKFDHLIWTAADPLATGFPNVNLADFRNMFDVRFWGPVTAAQHVYNKNLINPGGSITMSIGIVFNRPMSGWGLVSGCAGAVESLTRGLALDLKPIRVNTVSPGIVDTELWQSADPKIREAAFSHAEANLLVGRVAKPEDIAEAFLFAMKCAVFTGQVITVDGGGVLV